MPEERSRQLGTTARRRTRLRWGTVAGCSALLLGVSASTAPVVFADEKPQEALQAVSVELGKDGSITAVTSALVGHGEDGSTTRSTSLDPAENAGALPVRVTTSWRHDGRVGTDLSDVEGVSGRVEVDVTVQNTTVRPERFRYDAAGVSQDRYELVTVPMTVVASATLPADGGAGIVRPQPGATEPGTTNGVVSTDGETTSVQWASLLAPPRLSASTTFTLVQETEDFQLPTVNVAVQPGLATDTSIARLVGTAFGGAAERASSENNTIALIANVNTTLAEVVESLQKVRETLSTNAEQVGSTATDALASTADSVDAAVQSLLGDMRSLNDSVGATVQSTNTQAVAALRGSVQGMLDYFGSAGATAAPADASCGAQPSAAEPAPTLLGQLATVGRQLRELGSASGDCVEDLRATLTSTIGEATQCGTAGTALLVCRLLDAGSGLAELAVDLGDAGAAVLDELDPAAVDMVGVRIEGVVAAVRDLQTAGAGLATLVGGGVDPAVTALLEDLDDGLTAALAATDPEATGGLAGELRTIATVARDRLAELETGAGSISAQLGELAASICALPGADPAAADAARHLVDGQTCSGTPLGSPSTDFPTALTDRIDVQADAWRDVLAATDVDSASPQGAAAQLAAVHTQLGDSADQLADLEALVTAPVAGGPLGTAVTGLLTDLDALYDDGLPGWTCADPPAAPGPALNALATSFAVADCNQASVAADLRALLDDAAADVQAAGAQEVQDAAEDAEAAGSTADASLEGLSDALVQRLGAAADQQMEQGRAVVAAQRSRLEATQAAAARDLDVTAQGAVGRLADQVSAASVQQSAAAAALQGQLEKVLLDLGSARDGRGLLGVMQDSAGQAGVRTDQVDRTNQAAASFGGVRMAELSDAQLEQQQLVRALQAAGSFPAFAEELPDGSTSSTVFSFRLEGGR